MAWKTFFFAVLLIVIWLPIIFVSTLFISTASHTAQKREFLAKYLMTGDELQFMVDAKFYVYNSTGNTRVRIHGDTKWRPSKTMPFKDDLTINGHGLRHALWNLLAIQTGAVAGQVGMCTEYFDDIVCQATEYFISVRFGPLY